MKPATRLPSKGRLTPVEAGNPIDTLDGCLKDLPRDPLADLEAEHQAEIEANEHPLPAIRQRRIVIMMFTFVESSAFQAVLPVYLDDDEYAELQRFMMENPESGQLVPGSGGVRKLRWKRPGMGKRGGLRVIYFVRYNQTSSGCCPSTPRLSWTTSQDIF